jgi:5-formyltetrahydrofolate cyclo-ligase
MSSKATLRAYFRAGRGACGPEAVARIHGAVLEIIGPRRPVGLYFATQGEVATDQLFEMLGGAAYPRVLGRELRFHAVTRLAELQPGAFGIPEPSASAPEVEPQVLVVPGLAFDRSGHRLGYGGGFYDRYLCRSRALTIGIALAAHVCDPLPAEPHDQAVSWLVTEAGAWPTRR